MAQRSRRWLALAVMASAAACGGDSPAVLSDGLIRATDLPAPTWHTFEASKNSTSGSGVCGEPADPSVPKPEDSAAVAWARDPNDGPIVGERIERYSGSDAEEVMQAKALTSECSWEDAGSHWVATPEPGPGKGDQGHVYLIRSEDRPDSFNYQVAIRSKDTLVLLVLNSRVEDRDLLDAAVEGAWSRATEAGTVEE